MNVKAINETSETTEEFVSNEAEIELLDGVEYELELIIDGVTLNLKPHGGLVRLKKKSDVK